MLCGGSRLEIITETMEGDIYISLKIDSVVSEKLSRYTPEVSRVDFENLRSNYSALSAEADNSSNIFKRGGIETLHVFNTLLKIRQ